MEEGVYNEDCKVMEWVAQGSGKYHIPGNIKGQVGWGSEQSNLVESVPALPREVGLDAI